MNFGQNLCATRSLVKAKALIKERKSLVIRRTDNLTGGMMK